jgi:hypothetical protein
MKALRVHVERIVRPIHASVRRKNRMREELLGHLTSAFEDERALAGSDGEAFDRATKRLGDPAVLRRELQASVPWIERAGFSFLLLRLESDAFGKDERFGWRGSARIATEIVLLTAGLEAAFLALERTIGLNTGLNYGGFSLEYLSVIGGMLSLEWAALFTAFLLFDVVGARNAMSPWSPTPSFVKACLSVLHVFLMWALFLALAIPLAALFSGKTPHLLAEALTEDVRSIPNWIGLGIVCVTLGYLTIGKRRERRQYEKWGSLDIDAETGN